MLSSPEALTAGLGVARVAEETGRQPSQVSRALAALEEEGLVERDPASRRYALGWRLYAFAARTTEARLVALARPALIALAARTGEQASLCRLHGARVATLLTADAAGGPARARFDVDDIPAATTSTGRVLLSERDEAAAGRSAPTPRCSRGCARRATPWWTASSTPRSPAPPPRCAGSTAGSSPRSPSPAPRRACAPTSPPTPPPPPRPRATSPRTCSPP